MSGLPAFVSARLAPEDSGFDFFVTLRDADGRPLGEVGGEVSVRPGQDNDLSPADLRWRALTEAAAALGVRVGPWSVVDGEDVEIYAADVERPPLPPITCAPWCAQGDGHTRVLLAEEQVCESEWLEVGEHAVYLEQRPGGPVRLRVDRSGHPVLEVRPGVARVLARAILETAGEVQ